MTNSAFITETEKRHDRCLLRMTAGVSRRLQGTILFYIHGGLVRHSRADKPLCQVPVDLAVAPLISRRG